MNPKCVDTCSLEDRLIAVNIEIPVATGKRLVILRGMKTAITQELEIRYANEN
jgi:hypothetical protein